MAGLEQPLMLAISVLALPMVYLAVQRDSNFKKLVNISRALIIVLFALAAAQPFIQTEQEVMKTPQVTVLKDSSSSASLLEDVELEYEDVEVETKTIASGNSSDLRQGILRNIDKNSAYVAVSDFQSDSSLKDLARKIEQKNSSLSALKPETEDDASVVINGPDTTVPGAENQFKVKIHSTEDAPKPKVVLDGSQTDLEKISDTEWTFTKTFSSKGSHTVKASVDTADTYENNNEYFKTVEVTEKPKILFIGDEGALGRKLSKFYDVTYKDSLPENLDNYYSVISTKKIESPELSSYVAEGNGYIYTGNTEKEMDLLPVRKADTDQSTESAKLMITVDISKSTGDDGVKMSKKIAYNLVEELPGNTKVGVLAYNGEAYLVTKPVVLAENRQKLMSKISQLDTGGISEHQKGVKGSEKALNDTGNIIFISDGRAPDTTLNGRVIENDADEKALKAASELEDIRLISVGVGEERNEKFLRELAARGNGYYVDAKNSNTIKFSFTAGGAASGSSKIETVQEHFITRSLSLSSRVTNFDQVKTKSGADVLAAGRDGSLYLTSWRYGIGRVAAFSGGSDQLNLVLQEDPLLVSRTAAWTVGDPKRKQDRWIEVEDARRPEEIKVRASYKTGDLKRQSENLYTKTIVPSTKGFGSYENEVYAYNYPYEYQRVGYNPEMKDIVRDTGGQVYHPNETDELKQDIKSFSSKTTVKRQQLGSYIIALALLLFLAEVGYRKVKGKK